jgi:hypothetical protein
MRSWTMLRFPNTLGVIFGAGMNIGVLAAISPYKRNIDFQFQSVRPTRLQPAASASLQAAESQAAENISAGRTGRMPMFRQAVGRIS